MNDSQQTYLAIHVGHTRLKLGLFQFNSLGIAPVSLGNFSQSIDNEFPWTHFEKHFAQHPELISIVTGSNLIFTKQLVDQWDSRFESPVHLDSNSQIPVTAQVDFPEKVGEDRLLNAVAVNSMREDNSAAIIVDSGTAITVDAVNQNGDFIGGAILPGLLMGARAMHEFTTTLPLVTGEECLTSPPTAIGKNTEAAMESGLYWGHLGAVKEIVSRLQRQLGEDAQLFITGGATPLLQRHFPEAVCDPNLSMIGSVFTVRAMIRNQ